MPEDFTQQILNEALTWMPDIAEKVADSKFYDIYDENDVYRYMADVFEAIATKLRMKIADIQKN